MAEIYCFIPFLLVSLIAASANFSMVVHIFKVNNPRLGAGLTFTLLGIANTISSVLVVVQSAIRNLVIPNFVAWFVSTSLLVACLLQVGFNVALACVRLVVVYYPLQYFTTDARKALERKAWLVVVSLSLIVGISCNIIRYNFGSYRILGVTLSVSRLLGHIVLCILYYKLLQKMREDMTAVTAMQEEGAQSAKNEEIVVNRRKRMEISKRFFIGITASYFLLNLPSVVSFFIISERPKCSSTDGIIIAASQLLSSMNSVFDTIWYYCMYRRSNHL